MRLTNVLHLGVKELRALARDPIMLLLIVYALTLAVYASATTMPESLSRAAIAIVDEDRSPLSARIVAAFYPPYFLPPSMITDAEMDTRMDAGLDTFALNIPPNFQRDLLAGRRPAILLNVDATRMSQAFSGSGYVQAIVNVEVATFLQHHRPRDTSPVELVLRARFNPELRRAWFGAIIEVVNQVTMLAIILTGAALIREREHGTIEHLLVMPVTPTEIMLGKIWSMGLVVLLATAFSLNFIVQWALKVPIEGSLALFLAVATLHLFVTTSIGIFMATLARSMPQFGLLIMLVLLPMQMLSGGTTPRESMPILAQNIMQVAPTTHFVAAAQAILYRGAGFDVVWPQVLALIVIGAVFFVAALVHFRKSISQMD